MKSKPQTFRQRVYRFVFRREMDELQRMVDIFEHAYQRGGALMPPDVLIERLRENGQLTDLIMRLRGEMVAYGFNISNSDRTRTVRAARYYAQTDVSVERARNMWVDWGLGRRVEITSNDDAADEIISELMTARRNKNVLGQQNIHEEIGYRVLDEGEIALACWYSPLDGKITVQVLPSDKIGIVWRDPNLHDVPVFYKYTPSAAESIYFPDWRATDDMKNAVTLPADAKRADRPNAVTGVMKIGTRETGATLANMVWANRNKVQSIGRGMPQFTNGFEWSKVLAQFMGDRAAVARKAAMYTDIVTVDAGSRGVSDFVNRLQSGLVTGDRYVDDNPPYAAASDWIQNQALTREWQTRDTGATSARFDGRMLAGMLGQNTGIPLHWAGFPDAIPGGLATARELLKPWQFAIGRFQIWLATLFEDLAANALALAPAEFADNVEIKVTMETPIDVDFEFLAKMIGEVRESFTDGLIDDETARAVMTELLALALHEFGIKNPRDFLEMAPTTESARLLHHIQKHARDNGGFNEDAIAVLVAQMLDM